MGIRHKTGRVALRLNCVAGFESPACVFAGLGAIRMKHWLNSVLHKYLNSNHINKHPAALRPQEE